MKFLNIAPTQKYVKAPGAIILEGIRYLILIFVFKAKRVVPKIDEIMNNTRAMQRLADELMFRAIKFKKIVSFDKDFLAARKEVENTVFVRMPDVKEGKDSKLTDASNYEVKLEKLFKELGVDRSKIKDVKYYDKETRGNVSVKVTLEDFETKSIITKRKKHLGLGEVKEDWMKLVQIDGGQSHMDKYIEVMQINEKRLRNEVSKQRGESCRWVVRKAKVVKAQ